VGQRAERRCLVRPSHKRSTSQQALQPSRARRANVPDKRDTWKSVHALKTLAAWRVRATAGALVEIRRGATSPNVIHVRYADETAIPQRRGFYMGRGLRGKDGNVRVRMAWMTRHIGNELLVYRP